MKWVMKGVIGGNVGGAAKAVAYDPAGLFLAVGYHNGQIVLYHMTEANMGEVGRHFQNHCKLSAFHPLRECF